MTRSSQIRLLVHCILSDVSLGCAEQGKIFEIGQHETLRTTFHHLIDGDHLAVKIRIPDEGPPVSVRLAKVSWMQGERFGVELLVMDVDERTRLNRFLQVKSPPELEFRNTPPELTIRAMD